jgi:hypothetical protein
MEVRYTVVVPPFSDVSIYKNRYIKRGNNIDFTALIEINWDKWIGDIITKSSVNKTVVILPKDGCLQGYIEEYKGIKNVF